MNDLKLTKGFYLRIILKKINKNTHLLKRENYRIGTFKIVT